MVKLIKIRGNLMNIEIGKKIKTLRLQKRMTQEELAEKLNMSSQAVSKWENNVSMPDIQILPDLSVILGVTIDELFALTDDTHLKRIENMIYSERFIAKDDFSYAEHFLKEKLNDKNKKSECLTLLSKLHNHRADEHHEVAADYARDALVLAPDNKDNHCALREAENGVDCDWNSFNHHKLIDYYKNFVKNNPHYWQGYLWLMDSLIADGRCSEARISLENMNKIHQGYLYQLYGGMIYKEECNLPKALELWDQMTKLYPYEWAAWFSRGDCMVRICRYDEAVKYYLKGYELQAKPKYWDSLEAISHIYEIQEKYDKAIEKMDEIIVLLKSGWKITEGETVDFYKREIERLKKMLGLN